MKRITLAALVLSVPFAAQANLVTNGSFEDHGALANGNWGLFSSVPGWYAEADLIEIGHGPLYGVTGFADRDVLELDANHNAKVSQDINLGLGSYQVSFDYAGRSGIALGSVSLDVLWNDVVVGSINPSSSAMTGWSGLVNVTSAGTNKLSFQGTGTDDSFGALVDNVQMEAVPEPASIATVAIGLAAILRRRKK